MSVQHGWYIEETVGLGIANFDLGGGVRSWSYARELVHRKERRWAMCHGGVLTLVPMDYVLRTWEHFLEEETPGHFVKVRHSPTFR